MKYQTLKLIGSTLLAGGLGMWGAACASEEPAQTYSTQTTSGTNGGTPAAAGPVTGGPATGGPATGGPVTGAAVTGNTVAGPVTGGGVVGGTTGAAVTGVGGATASAVTGATTGTATTGTAPACTTPPALTVGTFMDFESYDGASTAADYGVVLSFDETTMVGSYAGAYGNGDELDAATAEFGMVAGNAGSLWAVRAANPSTVGWGGGVGFWIDCPVNVSSFTGLSLAVRGSSPEMTANVGLTNTAGTSFNVSVALTDTFTVMQLPFTGFMSDAATPVAATAADLASLSGITVGAQMTYVEDPATMTWNPEPGAFEVAVDDVMFY